MLRSQSDFQRAKKGAKFVGYPVAIVAFVGLVGAILGCKLDEGGSGRCDVIGINIGPVLNTIAAFGALVFMIVAIPATLYSLSNLASGYFFKIRERKSRDDV